MRKVFTREVMLIGAVVFGFVPASIGVAEDPQTLPPDQHKHFESKIRPVLVEHCYSCHSVEAGKAKGDLLLDSREAMRRGGASGPAVVPQVLAKSLLWAAISHGDPELKMPPKKPRLPDSVLADFEAWIRMGAPGSA